MEIGAYTGRRVDFNSYAVSVFKPHVFYGRFRSSLGCGATALALLTGVPPECIRAKNKQSHFKDEFMIQFLRQRRFAVQRLTVCNLSEHESPITESHVVLISQLFRKGEATWGVIADNCYYHNFDLFSLTNLALLNRPVVSAYLLVHPAWREFRIELAVPKIKRR